MSKGSKVSVPEGFKLPHGLSIPPDRGYYEEYDWTLDPRDYISVQRIMDKISVEYPGRSDIDPERGEFDYIVNDLFINEFYTTTRVDPNTIKYLIINFQIAQKASFRISELSESIKGADRGLLKEMRLSPDQLETWIYTYHKNFDYCNTKLNLKRYGRLADNAFQNTDVVTIDVSSSEHPYNAVLNPNLMSNINRELTVKATNLGMTLREYKSSWGHFPTSKSDVKNVYIDFDGTPWEPGIEYYIKERLMKLPPGMNRRDMPGSDFRQAPCKDASGNFTIDSCGNIVHCTYIYINDSQGRLRYGYRWPRANLDAELLEDILAEFENGTFKESFDKMNYAKNRLELLEDAISAKDQQLTKARLAGDPDSLQLLEELEELQSRIPDRENDILEATDFYNQVKDYLASNNVWLENIKANIEFKDVESFTISTPPCETNLNQTDNLNQTNNPYSNSGLDDEEKLDQILEDSDRLAKIMEQEILSGCRRDGSNCRLPCVKDASNICVNPSSTNKSSTNNSSTNKSLIKTITDTWNKYKILLIILIVFLVLLLLINPLISVIVLILFILFFVMADQEYIDKVTDILDKVTDTLDKVTANSKRKGPTT